MKVLIIYPDFYVYGGGETLVVRLCNYLTRNGVKNGILTMNMHPDVASDLEDTEVHLVERGSSSIGTLMALCRQVKKHSGSYDVINPHNYPAEITPFSSSKPSVWMCNEPELHLSLRHDSLRFKTKLYLKTLAPCEKYIVRNYITRYVVADRYNAERFIAIYGRKPSIINYGIDADYFSHGDRRAARERLGVGDEFIILHVGMLTKYKNQMASLEALNSLKSRLPTAKLVLAGFWDERYKRQVDEYIFRNSLCDRVVLTGHVKKEVIKDWYHAADVMLHPIMPQGGWLSPFEAMSAGTPVIVSKDMTVSDVIREENLGIVADDYSESILDVYKKRDENLERAYCGGKWVADNLSWDAYSQKMLDEFECAMRQ